MPSRRKSSHTTKIERVPRYEVYHGEEDYDDLFHSEDTLDQGLDLSMKRIKVEPMDHGDNGEDLRLPSKREAGEPREMESASSALTRMAVVVSGDSMEKQIASSRDGITHSNECESIADDANNGSDSDHMTLQLDTETQSSPAECTGTEAISTSASAVNASNGSRLFSHSSKGKKARPFKVYTTNRDLLSGLSTQVQTTLASYSMPIALTTSASGAGPLAFASVPLVNGASMIPVTASSATTSDASSGDAMGAGADASSTSTSSTTSATAKTTSTTRDAHLMTLADEADKILRERHESESSSGSTQDSLEGRTAESVSSYGSEMTIGEDGSVLKIPSLGRSGASNGDGSNSLSFIQQRALAAAVAATNPSKSKKKRNPLPANSKDIAYWERRRKNNEAAKRSRDARRAKEDQIAIRAALLEQENIRLKIELTALKEETVKLRAKLYSNNNS